MAVVKWWTNVWEITHEKYFSICKIILKLSQGHYNLHFDCNSVHNGDLCPNCDNDTYTAMYVIPQQWQLQEIMFCIQVVDLEF